MRIKDVDESLSEERRGIDIKSMEEKETRPRQPRASDVGSDQKEQASCPERVPPRVIDGPVRS